jgi:hypothetical protein
MTREIEAASSLFTLLLEAVAVQVLSVFSDDCIVVFVFYILFQLSLG